jgi:hypothetical protein
VAATGVDVLTSFASVLACIGNIGPGLGSVGPAENYALIPTLGKWVLILLYAPGPAGNFHGDYPVCAGILSEVETGWRERNLRAKFAGP